MASPIYLCGAPPERLGEWGALPVVSAVRSPRVNLCTCLRQEEQRARLNLLSHLWQEEQRARLNLLSRLISGRGAARTCGAAHRLTGPSSVIRQEQISLVEAEGLPAPAVRYIG